MEPIQTTKPNTEPIPISLTLEGKTAQYFKQLRKKWGLKNKTEVIRQALKTAHDHEFPHHQEEAST